MQTEANKMRAWLNISENINNAEFWEFVRLTKDKTGLPFDIYLDDNSAYIHHRHELWLYVNYNGTKIPITIEDDPKIKFINPNGIGDLTLLFHFIRENKGVIVSLANGKIDYEIFVKLIKPVNVSDFSFVPSTSKSYLTEMATLRPNKSKLPTIVWLDDDMLYLPHAPRIKFRADFQNDDTHFDPTMEIHNPENIHNLDKCKKCDLTKDDFEVLKKFVRANEHELRSLADRKIDINTFLAGMKIIGTDGQIIEPEKPEIGKFVNGFALYKLNGKYTFLRDDGTFLFDEPVFDTATNFQKFGDDEIYAYVSFGKKSYYINRNGNEIKI